MHVHASFQVNFQLKTVRSEKPSAQRSAANQISHCCMAKLIFTPATSITSPSFSSWRWATSAPFTLTGVFLSWGAMKYEVSPLLIMAATSGGDLNSDPLSLTVAILEPPMTVSLLLSMYCDSSVLPSRTVNLPVGVPDAAALGGAASGPVADGASAAPP